MSANKKASDIIKKIAEGLKKPQVSLIIEPRGTLDNISFFPPIYFGDDVALAHKITLNPTVHGVGSSKHVLAEDIVQKTTEKLNEASREIEGVLGRLLRDVEQIGKGFSEGEEEA